MPYSHPTCRNAHLGWDTDILTVFIKGRKGLKHKILDPSGKQTNSITNKTLNYGYIKKIETDFNSTVLLILSDTQL